MTNDAHGQTSNELRLETELDEIASFSVMQHVFLADWRLERGGKADARIAQSFADDLVQATKGAADHEKDVLRVDGRRLLFAPVAHVHHGLELARNIIRRAGRNL